jgi:L-ascorbate metabolism protein UlaG (beta-lactamase superfamily)
MPAIIFPWASKFGAGDDCSFNHGQHGDSMNWRGFTDWAKEKPATLHVADFLGRGRGRLRVLDHLSAPPPAPFKPDLSDWESQPLAAAWLGHATVLLRIDGMTILTDPVLSNRVGLGLGLMTGGPRRLVAAALSVRQLPRIDLILISHAHFDHLDRPTLVKLPKNVPVIAAHHTGDLIRDLGFKHVTELQWGETTTIEATKITAREVRHWGARTFYDKHRGFNGYLIESAKHRVLFGGDTAYHEHFRDLSQIDLAILGIGAYNPYSAAHACPEQATAMAGHCDAKHILPIHHSTFRLSHEPLHEPIDRMIAAAGNKVVIRQVGEVWRETRGSG